MKASQQSDPAHTGTALAPLALGALGVVYGDIGTSPLYALKACFTPEYGIAPTTANVTGLISLIVWTLTAVVSIKYVIFVMRADNHGAGGILALLALIRSGRCSGHARRRGAVLLALGLLGAALFYGDGVITPAISVLSAVEGISVATPAFGGWVVPISLAILFTLFMGQRFGTERIGRVFGPLMLLWFSAIGVLGVLQIVHEPRILIALSPFTAFQFLITHNFHTLLVLGAIVLAVTGAEALYADMGDFGRRSIRLTWFGLVFPALILNYLGQGALLLRTPSAITNPFYLLAPRVLLYPIVVLSTLAAIVASQALISGAFTITQQAMQLGYSPRLRIVHTSAKVEHQIYIPFVNTALMLACLLLVAAFRSSDSLAGAYGIAVTGTMVITSLLFYVVARSQWHWSALRAGTLTGLFLVVDIAFFGTNLFKILQGGWIPISIAALIYILLTTWEDGHDALIQLRRQAALPLDTVFQRLDNGSIMRIPGTAVFLTGHPDGAPEVLLQHLKHTDALHECVILLNLTTENIPEVADSDMITVEHLSHGFVRAIAHTGFMQTASAQGITSAIHRAGVSAPRSPRRVYYLPHNHVLAEGPSTMAHWRKRLFIIMARNARSIADSFGVPPDQAIELGTEVDL